MTITLDIAERKYLRECGAVPKKFLDSPLSTDYNLGNDRGQNTTAVLINLLSCFEHAPSIVHGRMWVLGTLLTKEPLKQV